MNLCKVLCKIVKNKFTIRTIRVKINVTVEFERECQSSIPFGSFYG